MLTLRISSTSCSLCFSSPCSRMLSPSSSASRPFSSLQRSCSFRSDLSSSWSSTSYLSRILLMLTGGRYRLRRGLPGPPQPPSWLTPRAHWRDAVGTGEGITPLQSWGTQAPFSLSPVLCCPLALLLGQGRVGLQAPDHQLDLFVPLLFHLLPQLPFSGEQPGFLGTEMANAASIPLRAQGWHCWRRAALAVTSFFM